MPFIANIYSNYLSMAFSRWAFAGMLMGCACASLAAPDINDTENALDESLQALKKDVLALNLSLIHI